jgi:threonine aldolase
MAALWEQKGGMLRYPVHTNICWLDLAAAGCSEDRFVALCAEAGLKSSGGRLVTHYQLALNRGDVLRRLEGVFARVLGEKEGGLQHKVGIGFM